MFTLVITKQAVVPYCDKFGWQNVKEKTADKLCACQRHDFTLGAVAIILVGEGHRLWIEAENTAVADDHAVSVTGKISENLGRARNRTFGVNDPLVSGGLIQQGSEMIAGSMDIAMELQFAFAIKLLESAAKSATEDF